MKVARIKKETIDKFVAFDNCFKSSTLFLNRKKFSNIDLLDIDFAFIEGNDVLDPNNCIDKWFDSELGPSGDAAAFVPTSDNVVDPPIINIDSPSH